MEFGVVIGGRTAMRKVDVGGPACGGRSRAIESTGSIFGSCPVLVFGGSAGGARGDCAHFAGSVCFNCRRVCCVDCLRGRVGLCASDHGEAGTSFKKTLRELGEL